VLEFFESSASGAVASKTTMAALHQCAVSAQFASLSDLLLDVAANPHGESSKTMLAVGTVRVTAGDALEHVASRADGPALLQSLRNGSDLLCHAVGKSLEGSASSSGINPSTAQRLSVAHEKLLASVLSPPKFTSDDPWVRFVNHIDMFVVEKLEHGQWKNLASCKSRVEAENRARVARQDLQGRGGPNLVVLNQAVFDEVNMVPYNRNRLQEKLAAIGWSAFQIPGESIVYVQHHNSLVAQWKSPM
jgi:hypothetical protein